MQLSSKQFLVSGGCHRVITLFPVDVSQKSICYRAYAVVGPFGKKLYFFIFIGTAEVYLIHDQGGGASI